MFKPIRAVLSLLVAAGMFAPIGAVEAQTSVKAGYEPFPSDPVYEYPTRWKTIKKWIDDRNWGRIRNHGWRLFIGANQPAKSNPSLRVFESWYTIPESFQPPSTGNMLGATEGAGAAQAAAAGFDALSNRRSLNKLQTATFGDHAVPISPNYSSTCGFAGTRFLNNGDLMIAGVYFSHEYYDHVRNNGYFSQPHLNTLWGGAPTAIENFPNKTFQVKHMYWPVPADGFAALPVIPNFNPASDPSNPSAPVVPSVPEKYNGYETWNRAVAVTAGTPPQKKVALTYAWRDFQGVPAVSVNDFYHVKIDAETYATLDETDKCILNQSAQGVYRRNFEPGDYLVTIAMHVMTRENADGVESGLLPSPAKPDMLANTWSLQTFWYAGAPAGGEGNRYRKNKPTRAAGIPDGPWVNYAMCQSYDAVEPLEGDGMPHVCSNPYIELVFPETYRSVSSCYSCHARGSYPPASSLTDTMPGRAHYNSEQRGPVPLDYYQALLFTDFSWSIPLSALPNVDPNK